MHSHALFAVASRCIHLFLLLFGFQWLAHAANQNTPTVPVTCPGLVPGSLPGLLECTGQCQQTTCAALESFFHSTYSSNGSATNVWEERQGWKTFLTESCDAILSSPATSTGLPTYCGWYGVTCCTGAPVLLSMVYPLVGKFQNCSSMKSVVEINLPVNGLVGSITDPVLQQSIAQLHACGMNQLALSGNALTGSITESWGELVNLNILRLGKNKITGTIPDVLQNLTNLISLELDRNPMHGTLPGWLSELHSLQWLGLSGLSGRNEDGRHGLIGTIPSSLGQLSLGCVGLGANSLTGMVPPGLCQPSVIVLDIRNNQLEGDLRFLLQCTNVLFLDSSHNKFSGTLPEVPPFTWFGMVWFDVSSNDITGTIPLSVYGLPSLFAINLAHNRLSGSIDNALKRMGSLMNINFADNQLTGTINDGIWYIPRLINIDLSQNQLTGTLSPAIGISYYSATVFLSNNKLHGRIPNELGLITNLAVADMTGNSLSCSGAIPEAIGSQSCDPGQLLPCFLQLTPVTIPRSDGSHMQCPIVIRKPYVLAARDCAGNNITQLGAQAGDLVDMEAQQQWSIDPGYFQFAGCTCIKGYHAVWNAQKNVLKCVQDTAASLPPWVVPISSVMGATGLMLLLVVGLVVWLRVTVQLRRKWQREKELMKNRLKGVPNGGPASIVVTDVESYSELMQQYGAVTTRAMGIHNAILRKAVTAHAGYVIEQEGDSWSVAFHRPVDAVAFCLQVQQALQRSHWPAELVGPRAPTAYDEPTSTASSQREDSLVTAEVMVKPGASRSKLSAPPDKAALYSMPVDDEQDAASIGSNTLDRAGSQVMSHSESPGLLQRIANLRHGSDSLAETAAATGKRGKPMQAAVGQVASSRTASVTQQKALRRASMESAVSSERATSITQTTDSKTARTNSVTWVGRGKGSARSAADGGQVRGVKVRMGVASGWVPAECDITQSALFELAKAVSDMAHGGQILLEAETAIAVREWLTDLGSVDHKGYNDKLLWRSHQAVMRKKTHTAFKFLTSCFSSAIRFATHDRDAILLDMGWFWVPSLVSLIQAAAITAGQHGTSHKSTLPTSSKDGSSCAEAPRTQPMLHLHGTAACVAAAAAATVLDGAGSAGVSCTGMHIYSIYARPLHARSKLWRGDLKLPKAAEQIAKGYFNAPGTVMADLGPAAFLDVERPLLPPVTIVFAAVEGGKALVQKQQHVAAVVNDVLSRTIQAVLLTLSDGYLCREQEAVLKYMVAFKEATKAAEWCLLMQDILRHVPWPSEVLEGFASLGARRTVSSGGGRATSSTAGLGARPKLKMGLAEGVPGEIAPDHLGHADYIGNSVNLAARIMSAAAQPGQIVMSLEMAQSVFSAWHYEAELLGQPKAAAPQLTPRSAGWLSLSGSGGDHGASNDSAETSQAPTGVTPSPALSAYHLMGDSKSLVSLSTEEALCSTGTTVLALQTTPAVPAATCSRVGFCRAVYTSPYGCKG